MDVTQSEQPQPQEMMMPSQAPINTTTEDTTSGEGEARLKPTRWESFVNSLQQGAADMPLGKPGEPGYLLRAAQQNDAANKDHQDNIPDLTPDEANKKYPGMPQPFTTNVSPHEAELMYANFQHREKLKAWAARGDTHFFDNLGAGVLNWISDPANLALTAALGPVGAIGGAAGVVAENLAIFGASSAMNYAQQKREHLNPSAAESAQEALIGVGIGSAIHLGFDAIFGKAEKVAKALPEDAKAEAVKTGLAQAESDSKINVAPALDTAKARVSGELAGSDSQFKFNPIQHPSETPFYTSKSGATGEIASHPDYGPGTYAVDNPAIANNAVAGTETKPGFIGKIDVPEKASVLNLEQEVTSLEGKKFIKTLEKDFGVKLDVQEGDTLKNVLDKLSDEPRPKMTANPDVVVQAQEAAKSLGYEGYSYVEDHGTGEPKHNGLVMFGQPEPSQVMGANSELAPTTPASEKEKFIADTTKPENAKDYTPEKAQEVRALEKGKSLNSEPDYMDPIIKENLDSTMAQLEKYKDNPEAQQILEQLKNEDKVDRDHTKAYQILTDCVNGSMT